MSYIEREAVLELIQEAFHKTDVNGEEQIGVLKCHRIVREAPTADVVEVVRCKDCAKDGLSTCPICYIEKQALIFINHDPDFYCAYGERKKE